MYKAFCFLASFAIVCSFNNAIYGQTGSSNPKPLSKPSASKDTDHSHAAHGPHDGELLEVGKEEYHLEVCTDEPNHKMVVYLMDKDVKSYVALDVEYIALNVKQNGKAVQYKLKATPQKMDAAGHASSFALTSPELFAALHDHQADARIALKIGTKPYTVRIVHEHDHAGHTHSGTAPTKPKTVR